jgi:precorrin-6B methylase 2
MTDINFDKRLFPLIKESGYLPEGYWVPEADRPKPLPPADSLPPDSSYQRRLARQVVEHPPERIIEVGSLLGSTIISMLLNCDASAVCIDKFMRNSRQQLEKNLKEFGLLSRVVIMTGDSKKLLPVIMTAYKPDLVHIDGDHRYSGALSDMSNATYLTVPAKWVVVHDLVDRGVAAAWAKWHKSVPARGKWNTHIEKDVYNHPGFLELLK